MEYLIIIVGNFLIGGMIGLTGIAGFLLPMLYSGFLGMSSAQGLALSFFAFLISGILGAYNYYRAKNLNLKLAVWISMGSFVGAVGGVRLNLLMEEGIVKKILYLVVLLSGISILLRKDEKEEKKKPARTKDDSLVLAGFWSGDWSDLRPLRGRWSNPGHAAARCLWRSGQDSGRNRPF